MQPNPDLDAYVERLLAQAPPLTDQQRDRLALILTATTDRPDEAA